MVAGWYYGRRLIFPLLHERSVRLWRGCRRKGIRTFSGAGSPRLFRTNGRRPAHGAYRLPTRTRRLRTRSRTVDPKGILNEVEQAALMTPLWNDLRQTYENGKVVTLEVPLRVGGTPLKAWSPRKADGHAGSVDGSTVTMKLILQKTSKPEINAIFIATFIPDSSCYNKRKDMKTPYRL